MCNTFVFALEATTKPAVNLDQLHRMKQALGAEHKQESQQRTLAMRKAEFKARPAIAQATPSTRFCDREKMSHAQSIYYQHKSIKTNISINIEPPANFDLIYVKKIDVVDGVLQKARPLSTFQVGLWYE